MKKLVDCCDKCGTPVDKPLIKVEDQELCETCSHKAAYFAWRKSRDSEKESNQ
jgi:DNA-directed RNA polymerase subunit RPC12/RpoP